MKCRRCRYYKGGCKLGLKENERCMWFKPSVKYYPIEKVA